MSLGQPTPESRSVWLAVWDRSVARVRYLPAGACRSDDPVGSAFAATSQGSRVLGRSEAGHLSTANEDADNGLTPASGSACRSPYAHVLSLHAP